MGLGLGRVSLEATHLVRGQSWSSSSHALADLHGAPRLCAACWQTALPEG